MIDFLTDFLNPNKRLFFGYLISAGFIAFIYLRWVLKKPLTSIVSGFFSSKIWFSRSTLADYKLMIINQLLIKSIPGFITAQLAITLYIFESMHLVLSRPSLSDTPQWIIITTFTLVLFIVDDYTRFALHRLLHRIPILWRFHKVHHSATNLTPFTVLRTHPIEAILFSSRSILVHALCLSVFYFYFANNIELYKIFGASIFVFLFHGLGSNLRHSHIWIGYWPWLEKILISPAQHQIHHSTNKDHYDCNFGAILAIWDQIGNSLVSSNRNQVTKVGLTNAPKDPHSLKEILISS